MQTRWKSSIYKPKQFSYLVSKSQVDVEEPKSVQEALQSTGWRTSKKEVESLKKNDTLKLVPYSTNYNIFGCKWVFKTKRNSEVVFKSLKAD